MERDSWIDVAAEFITVIAALLVAVQCVWFIGYTFFYKPMTKNYAECETVFLCKNQPYTNKET